MTSLDPDFFDSRLHAAKALLIIFIAALFIYGFRLGDSPLDRTEPFRALVAHQMVNSGDWLIPRLYGEVYLRKPPLIYWIEASVEKRFGHGNELIWRLPSVVGSAILAVFLAWWASRWFGSAARYPTGFACLALVALWDQNRSADIDALNTVAAVVTTALVLELVCGMRRWTIAWSFSLGISLGATLLLKGPGGLPQVFAALIGPSIILREWKIFRRISIWMGLLLGFGIFAAYIYFAKAAMHRAGIMLDQSGSQEMVDKIFSRFWRKRAWALSIPFVLIAFSLPVSEILPFAITAAKRGDEEARKAKAILGTLAAAAVIWLISGNDNPRYEYVMLPLLAPLVGYVWAVQSEWDLPRLLLPVGLLFSAAYLLVAVKLPFDIPDHLLVLIGAIISVLIFVIWGIGMLRSAPLASRSAGPVIVLLMLLFAIPMGERKNAERRKKSAKNAVAELRSVIGDSPRVSSVGVVRDLPELFHYANVDVDSFGEAGLPKLAATSRGHWVVISETDQYPAYSTLLGQIPDAFPHGLFKLHMPDPRDKIYVGYYDPPAEANTQIRWSFQKPTESDD